MRWPTVYLENDILYRARIVDKPILYSNVTELRYPPRKAVKCKGRLNDVGESIAYLTISPVSTYVELDCDFYQPICIAEISCICKDVKYFVSGVRGKYSNYTADELLVFNFLRKLLTSPKEEYYNATIAYSHMILRSQSNTPESMLGILYNSAREKKTNVMLHNIAVTPETFDKCFKITKVAYQLMTFSINDLSIPVVDINNGQVSSDGTINWSLSLDQMINECNLRFSNDIFMQYNENGTPCIIKYPEGSGEIVSSDDKWYYVHFDNGNENYRIVAIERAIVKV